jgi:hypothetical protein
VAARGVFRHQPGKLCELQKGCSSNARAAAAERRGTVSAIVAGMATTPSLVRSGRWLAAGLGLAVGAYAAYAGRTWWTYGRTRAAGPDWHDDLLDRFMPRYDVVERHQIKVDAPPAVTLAAAAEQDLTGSPLVRALFKTRALIMGAQGAERQLPKGLVAQVKALGWGVLAETDREIVMGAVTEPWKADVEFKAMPPDSFAVFDEPGFVKIVWTLRADPAGQGRSTFRTETRAVATDADARRRFRRYWSLAEPGIALIRWLSLAPLKCDAERRARLVSMA